METVIQDGLYAMEKVFFLDIMSSRQLFNCSLRAQLGSDDGSESKPSLCPQEFYSILKNKIN